MMILVLMVIVHSSLSLAATVGWVSTAQSAFLCVGAAFLLRGKCFFRRRIEISPLPERQSLQRESAEASAALKEGRLFEAELARRKETALKPGT